MVLKLNPSIFIHNNQTFALIRRETNTDNWQESYFYYTVCKLDKNLNIIDQHKCNFQINNKLFWRVKRKKIRKNKYCLEDIKIYKSKINNKIIGTTNILMKEGSPRIFRVGLIEFIIKTNTIKLIKIFNKEARNDMEKNWLIFERENEFYIIYTLFPSLIIYQLNINNFTLTLYKTKNTSEVLEKNKILLNNLHKDYCDLYFTPCSLIENDIDNYTLIIKKKEKNNYYYYYKLSFDFNNFTLTLNPNLLFSGELYYLNDIKFINNKYVGCLGVCDKAFEFLDLSKYINNVDT